MDSKQDNAMQQAKYTHQVTAKKTLRSGPLQGIVVDYSVKCCDMQSAMKLAFMLKDKPLTYSDVNISHLI